MDSLWDNFNIKAYFTDQLVKINLIFSFLVNLFIWLILLWQIRDFSGLVTLHYSIYFGIDLAGYWYQLFWLPGVGLALGLINFLLASLFFSKERILSYFLVSSSSFIQFLILLASLAITLINR